MPSLLFSPFGGRPNGCQRIELKAKGRPLNRAMLMSQTYLLTKRLNEGQSMTTWIIAYNKDGNTSILRTESEHQPDIDEAVELVTRKAEQKYADEDIEREHEPDLEDTPATRLAERFGITITGISQA